MFGYSYKKNKIQQLEERIAELEKRRFCASDIPIGEFYCKQYCINGVPYYTWVPFTLRQVVEVCPEGAIKIDRGYDEEKLWLRKDEFFYYSCVYTEIKKRIEEKMKEDKSK